MIRDEVSMAPHAPYSVGIATSGKDTGSTQMFFNLGDNTRLDGAYTVFAQVIDGRDVVDRLELGDRIIKATVQPFRGL
jgi:cyclophilin family peptidyl-prolyl cis-trans isomerase